MKLLGPNSDDVQKINAEVNQIVNQRLSLATLAVTVFGVMVAWLLPQSSLNIGRSVGTFVYSASVLLLLVLFALFLLSHHLTYMLRVFTTYLDVTGVSNWEKDWTAFRKAYWYWGYTRPQTIIFLLLGILSAMFPFLLAFAHSLTLDPTAGAVICVSAGVLYVVFVWGMGIRGWFTSEKMTHRRWQELYEAKHADSGNSI